jgi:hypothetical protein
MQTGTELPLAQFSNARSRACGGCAGPYTATVKVPVTEFSLRANSVVREPEIQSYWAQNRVYESLAETNTGVSGRTHSAAAWVSGVLGGRGPAQPARRRHALRAFEAEHAHGRPVRVCAHGKFDLDRPGPQLDGRGWGADAA